MAIAQGTKQKRINGDTTSSQMHSWLLNNSFSLKSYWKTLELNNYVVRGLCKPFNRVLYLLQNSTEQLKKIPKQIKSPDKKFHLLNFVDSSPIIEY